MFHKLCLSLIFSEHNLLFMFNTMQESIFISRYENNYTFIYFTLNFSLFSYKFSYNAEISWENSSWKTRVEIICYFPFSMSSRKYYYHRKPIGDLSETHRRSTCLIGYPSETDMLLRRPTCPFRDRLAPSETDIHNRRPTCFFGDRHAPSETEIHNRRPTFAIVERHGSGDPMENNMPAEFKHIYI